MNSDDFMPLAKIPPSAAAMPTVFTRGPLFEATRNGQREMYVRREIPNLHGGKLRIIYTGAQLDTNDQRVWMACIRLCRKVHIGQSVYTSYAELLRECGLKNTGPNIAALKNRLLRLTTASLDLLETEDYTLRMSGLLDICYLRKPVNRMTMTIRLREGSGEMYRDLAFMDWEDFEWIENEITARLMTFAVGHLPRKKQMHTIENLRIYLGYRDMRKDKFRAGLRTAGAELEYLGFLKVGSFSFSGNGSVVHWVREHQYVSYLKYSNSGKTMRGSTKQRKHVTYDKTSKAPKKWTDDDEFEPGVPF